MIKALVLFLMAFSSLRAESPVAPVEHPPLEHVVVSKPAEIPSYENSFIKMILTLGGLLFLVFFTLWAVRKLSNGRIGTFGSVKKIKILEKRPLSPKTSVYLLELDGKQVFIAESQLEVKKLLAPHEHEIELD